MKQIIDSNDQVIVRKVIYRNDENGWSVVWVVNKSGNSYTMVGTFPFLANGCWYDISGQFIEHPQYGHQFKVITHDEVGFKDKGSLKIYLYNLLGSEAAAHRIVSQFGLDAVSILDKNPELLSGISGIADDEAKFITSTWQRSRYVHKISNCLSQYGIDIYMAYKIYNKYGLSSLNEIEEDPYCICKIKGIPFDTGDSIALERGLGPSDEIRVKAIVYFALVKTANEGHTYVTASILDTYISSLAKSTQAPIIITPKARGDSLKTLVEDGLVYIEEEPNGDHSIYLKALHDAEAFIAHQMNKRVNLPVISSLEPDFSSFDKELDASQDVALRQCLNNRICILTGNAGSGKTTISKLILDTWKKNNINFIACCPTGIGTKQIEMKTGHPAQTIHRSFKFFPLEDIDTFSYEPQVQLINKDAILIDELSMTDIPLFSGILAGLPENIRIVMVGDPEQLPSVGPGSLLNDLIESGKIPVAKLTEPHRAAKDSLIIKNANLIREGKQVEIPRPNEYNNEDMLFVVKNSKESIVETIQNLISGFLDKKGYKLDDIQILSPMRKTDFGTLELNKEFQEFFNPNKSGYSISNSNFSFFEGDRIIQIDNNYDNDVYNGDIGKIYSVDDNIACISFYNLLNILEYGKSDINQIELSNCLTIHKYQGAESPVVILLCHNNFGRMLRRKIYYTGVTRAQKLCIIVGQESALKEAISNDRERKRLTSLNRRLMQG